MAWICPECGNPVDNALPLCPRCAPGTAGPERDLRMEAHFKAVGFWLVLVSFLTVVLGMALPLLADTLASRHRWLGRMEGGWAVVLILCTGLFLLGRGLYRQFAVARSLAIVLLILYCGGTGLLGLGLTLSVVSWGLVFLGLAFLANAVVAGWLLSVLGGDRAARVTGDVYLARFRDARPIARFWSSPWFWVLLGLHGVLVALAIYGLSGV